MAWTSTPSSDAVHILLVEDNPNDADLTRWAIEEIWEGVTIHHVTCTKDAIEYLRDVQTPTPDLVLLDLNLPGADGFDFLMAIKLHIRWRQVPVVVLSGSTAPEDRTHAYRNHANSYVVKPAEWAGYRHLAAELHRYWYNFNLPPGDKPMHLPLPPRHA